MLWKEGRAYQRSREESRGIGVLVEVSGRFAAVREYLGKGR